MKPNQLFERKYELEGSTYYELNDGRVIHDGDGVISYLDQHGNRTYWWRLVVDRSRYGMIADAVLIAIGAFLAPFLAVWAIGLIPIGPVQFMAFVIAIGIVSVVVLFVARSRVRDLRRRGASLGQGPSAERYGTFWQSLSLVVGAGALAAAIFNPRSPALGGFANFDGSLLDEVGFVTYQLLRVLSLDIVEIADAAWTDVVPVSTWAITMSVALNVLLSVGLVAFLVHGWNDMQKRAEPVVGNTYDLLWRLKREMTPGNKWVDLVGVAEGQEERTLTVREFIAAYEAELIPTSSPPQHADP